MRWSRETLKTLRETESDDLLVRAGMVLRDGTWTPFGERALERIRRLGWLPADAVRAELESGEAWWAPGKGKDELLACEACGYRGVRSRARPATGAASELRPVATPGMKGIAGVVAFLGIPAERLIKTLVMVAGGQPVAVLVRGDRAASLAKVRAVVGADVAMAGDEVVARVTGAAVGFAGPVGLTGVRIIGDEEVKGMKDVCTGGNQADVHLIGVEIDRDVIGAEWADVRLAREGDGCPRCEGTLARVSGRLLSSAARIAEAAVERHHDADGIVWPGAIAPVDVALVCLAPRDEALARAADAIHDGLVARGVEVLYDDREERPGVKFKDADLIGAPLRVTVGTKGLAEGKVELRARASGAVVKLGLDEIVDAIKGGSA